LKIQELKIEQIKPYDNNPRKNLNYDKVAKSIKEYGFQQPIVVDKNMSIIVGHTRYEAAKRLDLKTVPVVIADLPPLKAKAYRIADNRLNEDSKWDFSLLNKEFTDLMDNHFDLDNLGFDNKELENLITFEPEFKTDDDVPEMEDLDQDIMPSQVRMVQLFLDSETEPKFKEMLEFLKDKYKTNSITDTVYKAVENENYNLKE
jgi:ParB-like chromosome segregation protein Spo0J